MGSDLREVFRRILMRGLPEGAAWQVRFVYSPFGFPGVEEHEMDDLADAVGGFLLELGATKVAVELREGGGPPARLVAYGDTEFADYQRALERALAPYIARRKRRRAEIDARPARLALPSAEDEP